MTARTRAVRLRVWHEDRGCLLVFREASFTRTRVTVCYRNVNLERNVRRRARRQVVGMLLSVQDDVASAALGVFTLNIACTSIAA